MLCYMPEGLGQVPLSLCNLGTPALENHILWGVGVVVVCKICQLSDLRDSRELCVLQGHLSTPISTFQTCRASRGLIQAEDTGYDEIGEPSSP